MTLEKACELLGVELPEEMKAFESSNAEICTERLIDSLEEKFCLFGGYFNVVKEAWLEIKKDKAMALWLECAAKYYRICDHDHGRDLPVPSTDGSLAMDFIPLMVLLPSIENAYEIYKNRGFSHEEACEFLNCIKLNIHIVESRILGRPALTTTYFRWLAHYLKGTIFDHGGLNFEMKKAAKTAYYLKNKKSGEIEILNVRENVHRNGMPLGSAGYEDEDGAFSATFEETDDAYIGYKTQNFRIQKEKTLFPKEEWSLVLAPGDDIINVHIPRKTDLSPEKVRAAYKDALEITARCYPEYAPKAFICSSWLMDPTLPEIVGEDSRIAKFSAPYHRSPNKSAGKEIFSFVFKPDDAKDLSALPESTTLERGLKARYLENEYVYAFTGMLPFDRI